MTLRNSSSFVHKIKRFYNCYLQNGYIEIEPQWAPVQRALTNESTNELKEEKTQKNNRKMEQTVNWLLVACKCDCLWCLCVFLSPSICEYMLCLCVQLDSLYESNILFFIWLEFPLPLQFWFRKKKQLLECDLHFEELMQIDKNRM